MQVRPRPDGFARCWRGAILALLLACVLPAAGFAADEEIWSIEMRQAATPPPPKALRPANNSTLPGGGNVILSWSAEPQAASYRFQVAADDGFARVLHSAQRTILLFAARTLPPGRYFWRLASNRPDGGAGPWGPVLQFTVSAMEPAAQTEASPAAK